MQSISLTFNLRIKPNEIYDFRGAFIDMARHSDVLTNGEKQLFSNRIEEAEDTKGDPIQQYPKVQYRIDDGKASIWALNEGSAALGKLIGHKGQLDQFHMQNTHYPLSVIKEKQQDIETISIGKVLENEYLLFHFIPFNHQKEKEYHTLPTLREKIDLLEQILLNELVLLSYALGVPNNEAIKVEIIDIILKSKAKYKTKSESGKYVILEPQSYFLKFRSNFQIPDALSIGRHKAYGYGIIHRLM